MRPAAAPSKYSILIPGIRINLLLSLKIFSANAATFFDVNKIELGNAASTVTS